jgi:hypothetical protein
MIAAQRAKMSPADDPPAPGASSRPRRLRRSHVVAGAALGVVLGTVAAALLLSRREALDLPPLTPEALHAARQRWQTHRPPAYRMRVLLQRGAEPDEQVVVEASGARATALRRNGQIPSQRRTWDYWTVEGLFDMLALDLEHRADPQQAFGVSDPQRVRLYARFDAHYGFPRQYVRIVQAARGDLRWVIEEFVPHDAP